MGSSLDALNEPLRSAVRDMVAESRAAGRPITWTSTKRTKAEQAALRVQNGCPDVYDSPASSCRVPTAIPGTSRHETGDAIDFTDTDAVIAEVERLAGKYRIHRTVPGERWHYEHQSNSTRASDAPAPSSSGVGVGDVAGAVVDAATAPARAISHALGLLGDGATWVRIVSVAGGLVLVLLGLALLGVDLRARVTGLALKAVAR